MAKLALRAIRGFRPKRGNCSVDAPLRFASAAGGFAEWCGLIGRAVRPVEGAHDPPLRVGSADGSCADWRPLHCLQSLPGDASHSPRFDSAGPVIYFEKQSSYSGPAAEFALAEAEMVS